MRRSRSLGPGIHPGQCAAICKPVIQIVAVTTARVTVGQCHEVEVRAGLIIPVYPGSYPVVKQITVLGSPMHGAEIRNVKLKTGTSSLSNPVITPMSSQIQITYICIMIIVVVQVKGALIESRIRFIALLARFTSPTTIPAIQGT